MNIYDVAKYAGVSVATVSRVINNKEVVTDKTRRKVEEAIKELDYVPNDVARALASNKTNDIGIMVGNIRNYFDNQSAYELERNLKENNMVSILCNTSDEDKEKIEYLNVLQKKKVDGIITVGSTYGERDFLKELSKVSEDIPVVMLNVIDNTKASKLAYVCCDEVDAMEQSLKNFRDKGYKKPLLISRDQRFLTRAYITKKAGFIKGLKKYYPNNEFIELTINDIDKEIDDVIAYIKEEQVDAIQFEVDKIAICFYKFFIDRGIRIPEDLAICGFDNDLVTDYTDRRISSIDQRIPKQAQVAVETLIKLNNGDDVERVNMIKAKLVDKETS
ncbi:LacI family DNA-binding transcriptional regulator [Anaerococcus sp. AGMB09787]|uniref:LacI family DNA-binding transcriptional regulator n=1 Tax=Anaerococcus sp. AGMB09787 TaxID=2922869 RepID=UPI001FAF5C6D|nr:LacI family DNA-binding transcriptional regulator [Anaerococcus sp. AGMB09787]